MVDQTTPKQTNQSLEITPQIRQYLDGILTDAGMKTLDEGSREEMIKELFVRLDSYITSVIVDKLPEEHLDAFIKLNEQKKSMKEIEEFLKEKMPDSQEVFVRAFADFRDLYLGNVAVSRNAEPVKNMTDSKTT